MLVKESEISWEVLHLTRIFVRFKSHGGGRGAGLRGTLFPGTFAEHYAERPTISGIARPASATASSTLPVCLLRVGEQRGPSLEQNVLCWELDRRRRQQGSRAWHLVTGTRRPPCACLAHLKIILTCGSSIVHLQAYHSTTFTIVVLQTRKSADS